MNQFWGNSYIQAAAHYSVVVLSIIVFLSLFELVTRYRNLEQLKKGNLAIAMATGGKIYGIANIFRFSIQHNDSLITMLIWGVYGFILLVIGYFIFEFLTPRFNIDEELEKGNHAVGFIAMIISIGLSYVIGASIDT